MRVRVIGEAASRRSAGVRDLALPCPHFPACPGCPWIGRPYAQQLGDKHARVVSALAAACASQPPRVEPVVPAPEQTGYRVQAKLAVARARGDAVIGLYRPGSHRVVDVTRCPLHDPLITRALAVLRDALMIEHVPIHDGRRAGVRYVLLRASVRERRVLVTLVSSRPRLAAASALARRLRAALPLAGLLLNENTTAGNVIVGPRTHRLWGASELIDRYGAIELAASPVAFVQANTRMAARIYGAIADEAGLRGTERVVDLYCGVGGIALTLARGAARVIAIEEEPAAIRAAHGNATRNALANVRFEVGQVERRLATLAAFAPDLVTLNPPRKGCGPGVVDALLRARAPRLLYLSCDPETFARDAGALVRGGYRLAGVQPFDLMPQTDHVEVLGAFAHGDGRPRRRGRQRGEASVAGAPH